MAYSNYGAYVWKNGEEVTETCCDVPYIYKDKWILQDKNDEEECDVYAHAVLPIDDNVLLEFYKTHTLNIYVKNKKESIDIEKRILNQAKYKHVPTDTYIEGMILDLEECIFMYRIHYKKDVWCVVIGSSFGKGYDKYKISKYIKKRIRYEEREKNTFYWIDNKSEYELDYYCRLSTIQHIKDMRWAFGIKTLLRDIFKLKWYNLLYDIKEIIKYNTDIKYLK